MTLKKNTSLLLVFLVLSIVFISCVDNNNKKQIVAAQKYDGVTISVDVSNKNTLAILLVNDGTINRKGSGAIDSSDKNFFMGITKDKLLDSLMDGVTDDLLTYCSAIPPQCDTAQQTCKVKIGFGNYRMSCAIEHCVNGTFNDLPKTIKEFVERSIAITNSWYQTQKKALLK